MTTLRRTTTTRPGPWARLGVLDVEGHRGARGLAPENSLAAIRAGFEAGATAIEIDVRLSRDGHAVLWHDPILQPGTCRFTGPDLTGARVDQLDLARLRTVDIGSTPRPRFPHQQPDPTARIITLHEALELGAALDDTMWWTIEIKVEPTEPLSAATREPLLDVVLAEIHEHGLEQRCFVHSFDWSVLERSRQLAPALLRSALVEVGTTYAAGSTWLGPVAWEDHRDDIAGAVAELDACVVGPHFTTVDRTLVDRAHALGISVLPWTVNEPDDLRAMVALGVDGVVTDDPARTRLEIASFIA